MVIVVMAFQVLCGMHDDDILYTFLRICENWIRLAIEPEAL